MKKQLKIKIISKIMFCTGILMVFEIIFPTLALALTSGPSQPEFSSFEPVATTSMVNEFNGDFTYNIPVLNIPGANGGGYALSLSYHSGTTPEEEASWVGYGWTLNPGAINRGKKGFPDDFNATPVKYWNKTPANWTATLGGSLSMEAFSLDLKKLLGGSANASLRYNNYKGFGSSAGVNLSIGNGLVSLGYNTSDDGGCFSARVNPMAILSYAKDKKRVDEDKHTLKQGMDAAKTHKASFNKKALSGGMGAFSLLGSNYGLFNRGGFEKPTTINRYKGASYNVAFGFIPTGIPLQLGPSANIAGTYTRQENINGSGVAGQADVVNAYGYMYSADAVTADAAGSILGQMDYYTEKDNPYDQRDYYMGIPFSNADNYSVSGEGLGGGFRLYNKAPGQFMPREMSSRIVSYNLGVELEAGLDIGGGLDLGVGFQRFSSIGWNNRNRFDTYTQSLDETKLEDEPYFFRFNNDKGGFYDFNSDAIDAANPQFAGGRTGSKKFNADISQITGTANNGIRSGRSSYIAYHTNEEMEIKANNKRIKAYAPSQDVNQWITRTDPAIAKHVGEVAMYNEDGTRHVYGLPVYAKMEKSLSYDVNDATNIQSKYLVYKNISDDSKLKVKVGEETDAAYATSYLLTDITSTDYVDRTMDGPSDDDFGGYTRFSYNRVYGNNDKNAGSWYNWRIPYTGLSYNRGGLSNTKDDMGSVTTGEKEIYYLDTIVTKTHFAVFYTSTRNDGVDAATNNTAANSTTAKGINHLKKLDAIKLFAKNPGGAPKLLQTTRFEYYSDTDPLTLSKTLPNGDNANTGKLTLKRVWFEYEGAFNAKISPYVFQYTYPTGSTYPSKYTSIDNYGAGKTENPNYSAHGIDAWGNYQAWGANRYDSLMTWVNQSPPAVFDPAAWQLKVISLPSGGEIHVQYEQDDYLYVQNRNAEAMVSISSYDAASDRYYLAANKAFGVLAGSDKNYIRDQLQQNYVLGDKKIYFKFLYKLLDAAVPPNLTSCSSEYITGYCNIKEAGIDVSSGNLYVKLGRKKGGRKKFDLPGKVCIDFVKKERLGMLNLSGNCNAPPIGISDNNEDARKVVEQMIVYAGTKLLPGSAELCTQVNYGLSYFRVPVPPKGKKGGGLRVKRLMMYDAGMETGDKSLFGSEYIYKDENGYSSGVAANEPSGIREENALIEFDPRLKQKFLDKIVSGRDRDQTEKPLGESVLPSPSVGYSRIVIRNIFTGKTNPGFSIKEFYTAKDFPVTVDYSEIKKKKDYLPVPGGLINYFVNNLWLTQGYVCKLNEMHGQPKRDATYAGDPNDIAKQQLSTESLYEYYSPGELIPVSTSPNTISYQSLGKETEQVMESRGMEDISHNVAIEFDASVGFAALIPIIQFSIVPSYTYNESKLFTHVTNKIIQYPAIQKSVRTYAEGIYHLTENVAFNPYTGKPITSRTYDGFDKLNLQQSNYQNGTYTSFSIPASHQYPDMGQKAKNERLLYKSNVDEFKVEKKVNSGNYYLFVSAPEGISLCNFKSRFCTGDLIKLRKSTTGYEDAGIFHISKFSASGDTIYLQPTKNFTTASDGNYLNNDMIIEVLRSGCTNQLSPSTGGFTTYGTSNYATAVNDNAPFAAFLDYAYQHNLRIPATDNFFNLHKNLKISLDAQAAQVKYLKYPNGTYDATGVNTVFKNASGYIYIHDSLLLNNQGNPQLVTYFEISYGGTSPWTTYDGSSLIYGSYFVSQHGAIMISCHNTSADATGGETFTSILDNAGRGKSTAPKLSRIAMDGNGWFYATPYALYNLTSCAGNFYACQLLYLKAYTPALSPVTQVVNASAQTYDHKWPYDTLLYKPLPGANEFEAASKGKWRTLSSYAYNDTVIGANAGTQRTYKNAGVFDMIPFNWQNTALNDTAKWVKTSTVTKYSPDGNAMEEKDIFGIYSAAKFGYNKTQPYLVAKNADYGSVQFESFEKAYNVYAGVQLEDGLAPANINTYRTNAFAHAGVYSWKLTQFTNIELKPFVVTQQIINNGLSFKVWVRDTALVTRDETVSSYSPVSFDLTAGILTVGYGATKVARTGEWTLYETRVTDFPSGLGGLVTPRIVNLYSNKTIWIDDMRIQPANAQVMTYVYDINTLRLIATFDDQHFGMFYQYNGEGKLVRKQVETVRGIKTITETQYNSAKKLR